MDGENGRSLVVMEDIGPGMEDWGQVCKISKSKQDVWSGTILSILPGITMIHHRRFFFGPDQAIDRHRNGGWNGGVIISDRSLTWPMSG